MTKVSVIIPCYNVEKYLETCLQTLLGQTLQDLEFIFVDDGSTKDNTPAILDSFIGRDPRVKVIHQPNNGPGGARNTGILAAKGEYIGFIDSDDKITENYYEVLYNAAKRHDADIAWTNLLRTSGKHSHWRLRFTEEKVLETKKDIMALSYNIAVTRIYRRSLFDDKSLLFREKVFYEDIYFSAPMLYAANKVVLVPDAVYYYIINPTSIVRRRQTLQMQQNRYDAYLFKRTFYKEHGLDVPRGLRHIRKRDYTLGRITILKVKDYGKCDLVKLFDIIPIWIIPHKTPSGRQ